jgi:hypothetical protein
MHKQKIKVLVVDSDLLFLRLLTCSLQLEGTTHVRYAMVSAPLR